MNQTNVLGMYFIVVITDSHTKGYEVQNLHIYINVNKLMSVINFLFS